MSDKNEPIIHNAQGFAFTQAEWALIIDGRVAEIAKTNNHVNHPFGDAVKIPMGHPVPLSGNVVISVRGANAQVGYLVDSWGNLTPAEGRTEPLKPYESAMHDGSGHNYPSTVMVQPAEQPITEENSSAQGEPELPHDGESSEQVSE